MGNNDIGGMVGLGVGVALGLGALNLVNKSLNNNRRKYVVYVGDLRGEEFDTPGPAIKRVNRLRERGIKDAHVRVF